MAIVDLKREIDSGHPIGPIRSGRKILSPRIFGKLSLSANDTFLWKVRVIDSHGTAPLLHFNVYKRVGTNIQRTLALTGWSIQSSFPFTLGAGEYYVEIEGNVMDMVVEVDIGSSGIIFQAKLDGAAFIGETLIVDLHTHKKRPQQQCHEPLLYTLVEGQLPKDLKLARHDGQIYGIIAEQDCEEGDSASFNWFYENHDGVAQSWGRVYRFKLRIALLRDETVYEDAWFCIRVHNNWTLDRDDFIAEMKDVKPTVKLDNDTVVLPGYEHLIQAESAPTLTCLPCKDPTRPAQEETISLDTYHFHFVEELRDWWIANELASSRVIARLQNSTLLKEALFHPVAQAHYEITLDVGTVNVKRWKLEGRSLYDNDAMLFASRNIENQVREIALNGYTGEEATVSLWYW